jgi:two-component system, LytTR family, response regulator LytT
MPNKVLIVEDEPLAQDHLQRLLRLIQPDIQVLDCLDSIAQSVAWLQNRQSDLIFMDIHLADGLSFGIFEKIQVQTPVIFTTAYDEYALKAFKVNSIDYLLKPIDEDDLRAALHKFSQRIAASPALNLEQLLQAMQRPAVSWHERKTVMCTSSKTTAVVTSWTIGFPTWKACSTRPISSGSTAALSRIFRPSRA